MLLILINVGFHIPTTTINRDEDIWKKKDENHHCCLGCPLTADVDEFKFTHT